MKSDQTIALTGFYAAKDYPDQLRRIRFFDIEKRKTLTFLTNDFSLPAESIALLYKSRWQIELFFKWIKHLRIKAFFGTYENAIKTQMLIQPPKHDGRTGSQGLPPSLDHPKEKGNAYLNTPIWPTVPFCSTAEPRPSL